MINLKYCEKNSRHLTNSNLDSGAEVGVYTDGKWNKVSVQSLMLLDSAIMSTGQIIGTGLGNILYSNSTDAPFYSLDMEYFAISQSANVIESTGSFAIVGQFEDKSRGGNTYNGVMTMSPEGKVEGVYDIGVPSTNLARYGAFPTADTWYVTSGMWPTDDEDITEAMKNGKRRITRRVTLNGAKKVEFDTLSKSPKKKTASTDSDTGYYMTISKTTDGGKTFTTVYDASQNYYYPNGISCSDENHCVVAAEGYDEEGNPQVFAFLTEDGGSTWSNTMASQGPGELGLMSVNFISDNEVWLGGFGKESRTYEGHFWHSTDGGYTWTLDTSLDNCLVLDMDFAPPTGTGYAACVPPSGAAGTIAMYA